VSRDDRGCYFLPNQAEVRDEILQAMVRQPMSHRSEEFHEIFATAQAGLRQVFRTNRPVYVATASGTGMMEAAVRAAPVGRLLALVNGAFGERFVRIAQACGRDVDRYDVAAGEVPDPGDVGTLLQRGSYAAITMVHNETSTGAVADVAAITRIAHMADVAVIVDSISGVGGAPLEVGSLAIDCVVCASQKALGLPPGLSFATTTEQFIRDAEAVPCRGVYLDLAAYDAFVRANETPTTPSVPLIVALAAQMMAIRSEGIEARWDRHEAMRRLTESWVDETRSRLGLDLGILARAGNRSPTVTVITLPDGIDPRAVVRDVAARGFRIGLGYGDLAATSIRIGHMGDHTVDELGNCLDSVADVLGTLRATT
jgi:aspartate aminotransferase-like enzyme